ncbi:laminin subunit alpha-5-like, partial [Piliocolobus tephrosceles]|uniref:laminin subunit alpha-5-like n=1 Tax=Piliocolobus tephrosceles TaxID=591936 RepID=UPI000E6B3212
SQAYLASSTQLLPGAPAVARNPPEERAPAGQGPEEVFHVAYVLIKFANSPRPDLWVLERSMDFGRTYQPWQFFASSKRDCLERFGPQTLERITRDDAAICTTEYSRIVPLENGEIVVSLVNGRPGAMNFSYSPLLREFTKATNVRLRFLRTNTLLGHLMGKALRDPTVTRRYYYSIKDISIGGRCVCHGHADACDAKDPTDPFSSPNLSGHNRQLPCCRQPSPSLQPSRDQGPGWGWWDGGSQNPTSAMPCVPAFGGGQGHCRASTSRAPRTERAAALVLAPAHSWAPPRILSE